MKITCCGAAKVVTGSCYLLEANGEKVLVDCGMFQGTKEITRLNYEPFRFDPKEISHVLLTHAHIDHSGLLPKLAAGGFRGRILATSATADLCEIMLEDAAHIQITETEHENRLRMRQGLPPRAPLYTQEEAALCTPLFERVEYDREYEITKHMKARFRDAGHIVGSAILEVWLKDSGVDKKIVFSGDLGQWDAPIVKDPTLIEESDYVFVESTYGDRLHGETEDTETLLEKYVKETYKKKGKLMIPSFAVERTQDILHIFKKLARDGRFPDEEVFLDSPLAEKATEIFARHRETFDKETSKYREPFNFPNLVYSVSAEDSIRLNTYDKPCVIIAGSGMSNAGRIRHHYKHGIWDPKNTVLFVGYQAEGTLGRAIIEGAKTIKLNGMEIAVKADIRSISGFSAHADYGELIRWMQGFKKKPGKVFIVHGEERSTKAMKAKLEELGFDCHIPSLGEAIEL